MDNKLLEKVLYKIFKIIIMFYLYVKNNVIKNNVIKNNVIKNNVIKNNVIKNDKYKVTHSCVVSNKGEYIKDITDLVKVYKICPKTKIEFYKSLIKDTNVVVHVYLERGYEKGEDIEIKYIL